MGLTKNQAPQPIIGQLYASDDYNYLGTEFFIGDDKYRFVFLNKGQILRSGAAVYFDSNYNASQTVDVTWYVNGIVPLSREGAAGVSIPVVWDLTSSPYANGAYALVWVSGGTTIVNKPGDDNGNNTGAFGGGTINGISCVYEKAQLVPFLNGCVIPINAVYNANTTYAVTNTVTCGVSFQLATTANATAMVSPGDLINTSTGLYGAIVGVVNGSSLTTTITSLGVANGSSHVVRVIKSIGKAGQAQMFTTCSAGQQYKIPAISNSAVSNVCTAATVVFCTTGIAGYLVKVGDRVTVANQTGYSTLAVTSINNSTAFTVNASITVDQIGNIGVDVLNVNVNNYVAQIKS